MPEKEAMNRKIYTQWLTHVTERLRVGLGMNESDRVDTAIVLGTGWADAFAFQVEHSIAMKTLSGPFEAVNDLEGHARSYEIGQVNSKRIVVLRGRVHMNEFTFNPAGKLAVRAQVEVLCKLGIHNLVLTAAVGSLSDDVKVGSIVLINGWVSGWSEEMPLFGGEFVNPEDKIARMHFPDIQEAAKLANLQSHKGAHIFWVGPHFEGRLIDKHFMLEAGAICVGMSIKPEAAVTALYDGVQIIPIGFVTDEPTEETNHQHNCEVAQNAAHKLGQFLERVIAMLNP